MSNLFTWHTYDVRSLLPANWQDDILGVAKEANTVRELKPPHVTSREDPSVTGLVIRGVNAAGVRSALPWLTELYEGQFRSLAQQLTDEPVSTAVGRRHTVVLNVQLAGDERYECHVDTNPIQGLLYVTSQPEGHGGELVVSNRTDARSLEQIDADCSVIYPQTGYLVFFDARRHPHYIRPLRASVGIRVAVAMNFYVPSCPEEVRPEDLDDYLAGDVPRITG